MFEEKSVCSSSFNDWLRFRIDFKWIFSIDIFRQCSFITIFFLVENYEKWIAISSIGTWSTRFLRVWKCFPREYYREAWIRLLMANHRGIFAEMKTAARLSRPSLKHSFFLVCVSESLPTKNSIPIQMYRHDPLNLSMLLLVLLYPVERIRTRVSSINSVLLKWITKLLEVFLIIEENAKLAKWSEVDYWKNRDD